MKGNSNNKWAIVALVAVAGALVALMAEAQFVPLEECYWECAVEYCDYPDDYCNYECHEICYPILRERPEQSREAADKEGPSVSELKRPMDALPVRNHQLAGALAKDNSGRIGKVIKMKLENPAYETMRRGKYVLTRGSPPRGFALFQDCLSADRKPAAGLENNRTRRA